MRYHVLLHICCAPCLIHPLQRLREEGFQVSGFFYNPNIHPFAEYKARRRSVEDYTGKAFLETGYPEYAPEEFFRAANMREEKNERCLVCWERRLRMTAQTAAQRGFSHFSTTLLVSPYQDGGELRRIGFEIAADEGVEFFDEDFRPGFRAAHAQARAQGMYCQKYCGCIYSEIERYGLVSAGEKECRYEQNITRGAG